MSAEDRVFYNPAEHPEWTPMHSLEWYKQVASEYEAYRYPWKSEFEGPIAEAVFGECIASKVTDTSHVLDLGCGHGEFLMKWASRSKEAVGIDRIDGFIATAKQTRIQDSFQFLIVDVKEGLPFPDHYFDIVYSKKGPWLFNDHNREGNRVVKPGGAVFQLIHGGTDGGLRELFPGLYARSDTPWSRDRGIQSVWANLQLQESRLSNIDVQVIEEVEYLSRPEDVLIKKCFGQNKKLKDYVWRENLSRVEEIFHKHAAPRGLKVINYYYVVSADAV